VRSCTLQSLIAPLDTPSRQLSSKDAAEEWMACMYATRVDLQQKLQLEREAVTTADQRIAAATADILRSRDREKSAVEEAGKSAAELNDVMLSVERIQAQLPQLEKMSQDCSVLERRLALELQTLQLNVVNANIESLSCGSAVVSQSSAAFSHLPHDLVARVNAVLDKVPDSLFGFLCEAFCCALFQCVCVGRSG
jgi:hypothetical protein